MVLKGLSFVTDSMPVVLSVAGLLGMLYGLVKYRETVGKAVIFMLRKVTRRRR